MNDNFLKQLRKKTHIDGTYIEVKFDDGDVARLFQWIEQNFMPGLHVEREDIHATVIYSTKPNIKAVEEIGPVNIKVELDEFELFGDNSDFLVIKLKSEVLHDLNARLVEKYGFISDYDEYQPHITIAKKYHGPIPKKVPPMSLIATWLNVEGID